MKKYGMLMTPANAQKCHDGDKTVTRRVVKDGSYDGDQLIESPKPRYRPGMIVAIKETHWRWGKWVKNGISKIGRQKWRFRPLYRTYGAEIIFDPSEAGELPCNRAATGYHKRSSLFLPYDYARTHVEILSVRPERLQEITEGDAMREGIIKRYGTSTAVDDGYYTFAGCVPGLHAGSAKRAFQFLWDSINAKKAPWESDPWVWRYAFKRVQP